MAEPPNILVFLTDDHGPWSIGCYGNREAHSPTMDYLARDGARMRNAFTPCPVCSPARASFYTGRLPSQHGIHDWIHEPDEATGRQHPGLAGQTHIAQRLQAAGYETAQIGKWHCGQSWDPKPGFDRWFSYGDFQFPHRGDIKMSDQGRVFDFHGYQTPLFTDKAIDFLRTRTRARPFFMFVGYVDTHTPYDEHPQRLVSRYRDCTFADIPRETFSRAHHHINFGWAHDPDSEAERTARAQYYAAVSMIDGQMGRVLDELDSQGDLDNTLIVYTADHGNMCGHHGLNTKGNATIPQNFLEESIRIPMLFRWPGHVPAGRAHDPFVDLCDLHQTLLAVAGARPDAARRDETDAPGRSFLPLLEGGAQDDWEDVYFGEYGNARCMRTRTLKYVQRFPGPNGSFGDELYDLGEDPRETRNVIAEADYADARQDLPARLEAHFTRYEIAGRSGREIEKLPLCNAGQQPWRLPAQDRA